MSISLSPVTFDLLSPLYAKHVEVHELLNNVRATFPGDFDVRPEYLTLVAAANGIGVALDCLRAYGELAS
jgi:hypothetical protein